MAFQHRKVRRQLPREQVIEAHEHGLDRTAVACKHGELDQGAHRLRAVLHVDVREAYFHCGKALMRSKLWTAENRVKRDVFPSIAEVIHDQTGLGEPEKQAAILARYETQL